MTTASRITKPEQRNKPIFRTPAQEEIDASRRTAIKKTRALPDEYDKRRR